MVKYQNVNKEVSVGDTAAIVDGRSLFIAQIKQVTPLQVCVQKKATLSADGQFNGFANMEHSIYKAKPITFESTPKIYFVKD